jgi:hypothetical protein
MRRWKTLAWAGLALAAPLGWAASAYVPAHDDEVVEVLRERPLDPRERAWKAARNAARAHPQDLGIALNVAWQAVQWARQDGDPRLLGQAQAALRTWWALPAPPPEVRLLRATILQSTHRFDEALSDLQVLVRTPAGGSWPQEQRDQAWLTLASVLLVTGHYGEAADACRPLLAEVAPQPALLGQACLLETESYRGAGEASLQGLNQLVTQAPRELHGHINLIRAELAERLGQAELAERLYKVLSFSTSQAYVLGVYADLLLDQGRPQEVLVLLKGRARNDALLLRLAEASQAAGDQAAAAAQVAALRARFAAARERGDSVHRREEARFTLRLLHQPAQALQLAEQNWRVQKEPADARVLMECALAARAVPALDEVKTFVRRWGWRDRRLERLL